MSLRIRALTEISNWSTDDLLEVVQKNRFNDCSEPLKIRQIDGAALLSVTELNIKFWKLPKHREKDFFAFINEIKENPEKYVKPKTKTLPKPQENQEKRPIGKLALQLKTALREKQLNSSDLRKSPSRKPPLPPPPVPTIEDDLEIYENTNQTSEDLHETNQEKFQSQLLSQIHEKANSKSPSLGKKLPPTPSLDDETQVYENTIPESPQPPEDHSQNDPIYVNIPQAKSKPIPIAIKKRDKSSSSDDSFIGSYESLPSPSTPKRPPQTPPLPPKPNAPPPPVRRTPQIALVKPTKVPEKLQGPPKSSSVVQGLQAHFQSKGQKIDVPKTLPKPPPTFHYRGNFGEKTDEEDDEYLTPIESNSSPKPEKKNLNVTNRPLPEIPVGQSKNHFQNVDRTTAIRQIQGRPDGHFLFRPSTQPGLECSLTISYQLEVYNIVVRRRKDGHLAMGNEKPDEITFNNLQDIVDYYRVNPLTLYRHQKPVGNVYFKTN